MSWERRCCRLALLPGFQPTVVLTEWRRFILNSVSNVGKAIQYLRDYSTIHCYLDNDNAGKSAFAAISAECDNVIDCSTLYSQFNDLNEFLIQSASQPDVFGSDTPFEILAAHLISATLICEANCIIPFTSAINSDTPRLRHKAIGCGISRHCDRNIRHHSRCRPTSTVGMTSVLAKGATSSTLQPKYITLTICAI